MPALLDVSYANIDGVIEFASDDKARLLLGELYSRRCRDFLTLVDAVDLDTGERVPHVVAVHVREGWLCRHADPVRVDPKTGSIARIEERNKRLRVTIDVDALILARGPQ